jgi:predicted dehydrogenase
LADRNGSGTARQRDGNRAAAGLCLEAGKAVLCEKILTVNAAEAKELVALAWDRGCFLLTSPPHG